MLARHVEVRPEERRGMWFAFALFFCLMCGYSILKPLRDEMAVLGQTRDISLAVMFTWTFAGMLVAVPLYSALAARFPRHKVIPAVYRFFLLQLLGFFAALKLGVAPHQVAVVFYVWVSVYNLFVVSVFWSFLADLFADEQGRRLFGFIAAGGTTGALAGSGLTALLAIPLGPANLLLLSAALLQASVLCVGGLTRWSRERMAHQPTQIPNPEAPLGGGMFAGIQLLLGSPYLLLLGAQTLLYTACSTFLYFHQQKIVAAALTDSARRTALFAGLDLAVQGLTLLLQVLVTGRLIRRLGLAVSLGVVPAITALGFLGLAAWPVLPVLLVFRSLRGATHYAFERPSREILFTAVAREPKYKAKNFIDTAVYRGSDLASGWLHTGLGALGLGLSGIALIGVPVAGLWLATSLALARRQRTEALHLEQDQRAAALAAAPAGALPLPVSPDQELRA